MDKEIASELKAWIQFFRDMGIEDFYSRGAATEPAVENASPDAKTESPPAGPGVAHSPAAAPEPAREFRAVNTPAPISLSRPAQTLGLFESAPSEPQHKLETLDDVRKDLGDCHRCKLWSGRKHIVFGQGNPHAELVLVGEGPGADEDEQGLPFVGRAGQLLNRVLQLVEIKREEVYICNVVKCRPPGNRVPEADEVAACSPFLFRQFEAIKPKLICCMGAPAARTVLGVKEGITKIHGQVFDYSGTKAIVTVHPAYVLRNPREEKILRGDFEKIKEFIAR